jgi:hypothetical protein
MFKSEAEEDGSDLIRARENDQKRAEAKRRTRALRGSIPAEPRAKSKKQLNREAANRRKATHNPVSLTRSLIIYPNQEEVLYRVSNYLHATFDQKSTTAWSIGISCFAAPKGVESNSCAWQRLSSLCYGAGTLCQSGLMCKTEAILRVFFQDLRSVARETRDPAFLSWFWKTCLRFISINHRAPYLQVFPRLFDLLQEVMSATPREEPPFVKIVQALTRVEPDDFKSTLRLGLYMNIKTIEGFFNDECPITLHMRMVYWRHWDKQYAVPMTLYQKLQHVCASTSVAMGSPTARIELKYYSLYASRYFCQAETEIAREEAAKELWRLCMQLHLESGGSTRTPSRCKHTCLAPRYSRSFITIARNSIGVSRS